MPAPHDRASDLLAAPSEAIRRFSASSGPSAPGPSQVELATSDPLSDVLRVVKLTGALFFMVDASSPWSVHVPRAGVFAPLILPQARHIISYHVVVRGAGWASAGEDAPVRFAAGDVIVFPHADPYAMSSTPGQPPELDSQQTLDFFREMAAGRLPFVVAEGGGGADRAQFVCGFLGCDARPFNPLLKTLPRMLHIRRPAQAPDALLDGLIELTLTEVRRRSAGSECVRLRLSELMFIEVVRRHITALPADGIGWLAGLRDPGVGRALALLHARPADDWTLEHLAQEAGMSRSVLAHRFMHLVGYPPMQYLARWRMQLAARLLADGRAKVSDVGREVGYASEAAFSRTFKKIAGVSPRGWRGRHAAQ